MWCLIHVEIRSTFIIGIGRLHHWIIAQTTEQFASIDYSSVGDSVKLVMIFNGNNGNNQILLSTFSALGSNFLFYYKFQLDEYLIEHTLNHCSIVT